MSTTKKPAPRRSRVALGSGRGPVRKALDAALAEARGAGRMTLEHDVRGLLACRLADVVDRAAREGDADRLRSASRELLEVLDQLPVRVVTGGGDNVGGSDRARLISIMDGGPTRGDGSNT